MQDDTTAPRPFPPGASHRLYPKLLGPAWQQLDPAVQRAHTDDALTHAVGVFQVRRAPGGLLGRIFDLVHVPRASDAVQVRLTVRHRGLVERWHRTFGGRPLVTIQSEGPGGLMAERIGALEFRARLSVVDGVLLYRHAGLVLRLGPLTIPLPDWLSIKVDGREGPAGGPDGAGDRTAVEVRVTAPGGVLLFAYRGTVRWRSGERV